jgi:hypothetical protein
MIVPVIDCGGGMAAPFPSPYEVGERKGWEWGEAGALGWESRKGQEETWQSGASWG